MTINPVHAVFEELDDLLEDERVSLLAGNLDDVSRLMVRKVTLIEKLEGLSEGDRADLMALQSKITRNQALLEGSLQGIRAVADRLATLRRLRREMETYDQQGNKKLIQGHATPRVERRA